jgi:hypothetical protein
MTIRDDILLSLGAFVFGGVSIVSGVASVVADEPGLMVLTLTSIVLTILLGLRARTANRRLGGSVGWSGVASSGLVLGVVGLAFAALLPFA